MRGSNDVLDAGEPRKVLGGPAGMLSFEVGRWLLRTYLLLLSWHGDKTDAEKSSLADKSRLASKPESAGCLDPCFGGVHCPLAQNPKTEEIPEARALPI